MLAHITQMHQNLNDRSVGSTDLITLRQILKTYQTGGKSFTALDSISLTIGQGEFTAIVGKSGSGKSTLLNIITGIDPIGEGSLERLTAGYSLAPSCSSSVRTRGFMKKESLGMNCAA